MINTKFKREERYIVIKISNADKYLSDIQKEQLTEINSTLQRGLRSNKKRYKNYVCVADDWPMFDDMWKAIEEWVADD